MGAGEGDAPDGGGVAPQRVCQGAWGGEHNPTDPKRGGRAPYVPHVGGCVGYWTRFSQTGRVANLMEGGGQGGPNRRGGGGNESPSKFGIKKRHEKNPTGGARFRETGKPGGQLHTGEGLQRR